MTSEASELPPGGAVRCSGHLGDIPVRWVHCRRRTPAFSHLFHEHLAHTLVGIFRLFLLSHHLFPRTENNIRRVENHIFSRSLYRSFLRPPPGSTVPLECPSHIRKRCQTCGLGPKIKKIYKYGLRLASSPHFHRSSPSQYSPRRHLTPPHDNAKDEMKLRMRTDMIKVQLM